MRRAAERAGLNFRRVPKGYSYNWLPAIGASASCASHMAASCTAATGSLDPDHFQTSSLVLHCLMLVLAPVVVIACLNMDCVDPTLADASGDPGLKCAGRSVATGTTYPGKNLNGALNTVLVEGSSCALVEWGQMGHLQDVHLDARGFGGGASDG